MESYSYYTMNDDHTLTHYTYNEIVWAVRSGAIDKNTTIMVIDNLLSDKKYIKAKDVL